MSTSRQSPEDFREDADDHPSSVRVERFLESIDDRQAAARRTRWVGMGVALAIGGVAFLTAVGVIPVQAEGLVVSASAVVAGLAMSKN